jgi:hypothetical protein
VTSLLKARRNEFTALKQIINLFSVNVFATIINICLYTTVIGKIGLEGFAYINTLLVGLAFAAGVAGFGLPESLQKAVGDAKVKCISIPLGGIMTAVPTAAYIIYQKQISGHCIKLEDAIAISFGLVSIIIIECGSRILLQLGQTTLAGFVNLVPNLIFWSTLAIIPKTFAVSSCALIFSVINITFASLIIAKSRNVFHQIKISPLLFQRGSIGESAYISRVVLAGFDLLPLILLQSAKMNCLAGLYSFIGRFFFPMVLTLNVSAAVFQKSRFSGSDDMTYKLRQKTFKFAILVGIFLVGFCTVAFHIFGAKIFKAENCDVSQIKLGDLFGLLVFKSVYICCKFLIESDVGFVNLISLRISALLAFGVFGFMLGYGEIENQGNLAIVIWLMTFILILLRCIVSRRG